MIINNTEHKNNYSLTQTPPNSTNGHNSQHDPKRLKTSLTQPIYTHRPRPPLIMQVIRKIEWIADKPKWWHFSHAFRRWLYGMRSKRREAVLLVLKAMAVKMDQRTFDVQLTAGVAMRHDQLQRLTGLKRRTYYRALADLKAAGYVTSFAKNKRTGRGDIRGFAGPKRLTKKLFRALKLDKAIKRLDALDLVKAQEAAAKQQDKPESITKTSFGDFKALLSRCFKPPP